MGSHYRFTQSNMRTSTALFFTFLFLFLSLQVTAKKGKGTIGKILDHVKDIKQSIAASDLSLTLELFDDDLLHCNFIITFDGGADQRGCGRLETLASSASKTQGGGIFVTNLPPPGVRTCRIQEITSKCIVTGGDPNVPLPCGTFSGADLNPSATTGYVLHVIRSQEENCVIVPE